MRKTYSISSFIYITYYCSTNSYNFTNKYESVIPPIIIDNVAVITTAILYLLVIFRVIKGRHIW